MADDEGDLTGHRIAVHRDGAILASEQLDATDLIDESLTGIDAAVAVLHETAAVATRLVAAARPAARRPPNPSRWATTRCTWPPHNPAGPKASASAAATPAPTARPRRNPLT